MPFGRADEDFRVQKPGGANHLFDDLDALFAFKVAGRGADKYLLPDARVKLVKGQRTVIKRRRQPEAEIDKGFLSRTVAAVHPAHLRECYMGFVDKQQEILGEII